MATKNVINTSYPIEVAAGGTGRATLTTHGVLVGATTAAITQLTAGTNGQVLLGSTGADPVFATLTSTGSTIVFTTGAGTLNLETSSGLADSFPTDSGTATPSAGALTVHGGANIGTTGAGSTVTVNLDTDITGVDTITLNHLGALRTQTLASNAFFLQAYDVDGASYTTFATLQANNTPTMDLSDTVTKAGGYIYRAGGSDVAVSDGGTGRGSITGHSVLVGNNTSAITALGIGTNGQVLIGATAADPAFATLTSTGSTITFTTGANTLNLEAGGAVAISFPTDSGTATPSSGVLTMTGGTNIGTTGSGSTVTINLDAGITAMSSVDFANAGRLGTGTGAGNTYLLQAYDVDGVAYTTFATLTANNTPTMDLSDAVTKSGGYIYRAGGTDVPVADGGTGVSTLTNHAVLVGAATSAVTQLTVGTNGQVLIGASAADPAFATLTSTGGTVAFTTGANTLNLEVVGGGVKWTEVTGTSAALAVNNGYIANNAGLVTLTLPASAAIGDTIIVTGKGAGGWRIAQNSGQTIYFGTSTTTTGATGRLDSSATRDSITLTCVTANNDFNAYAAQGNITVT